MTYIAQLILVGQLRRQDLRIAVEPAWILSALWWLAQAILVVGLLSVLLGVTLSSYNRIEDAFEWVLSVMLQMHFCLVAIIWHKGNYRGNLSMTAS